MSVPYRPARRASSAPVAAVVNLRAAALVGALLMAATPARAHWLRPEEIVAGIAADPQLQRSMGVTGARNDPDLPRLLIIRVQRDVWDRAPEAERRAQAEEWLTTWRHNVPQGIVAVVDARTEESLVNFDGVGNARLAPATQATPGS